MDLRELRAFVTVAEEQQFTRAALRLGIAQSSLSAQVRQLERELGVPLFHRTTRHVSLSDAGAVLLERARVVLADVADVTAEIRRMQGMLSGRVVIGVTQTPGPVDVLGLLAGFSRRYPAIELQVREDLSVALADELRADRLDLGILSIVEPSDCRGLSMAPLAEEELVVIVPVGHPLAERARLSIADLGDQRLITSPAGATIRRVVMSAAQAAGITLDVGIESREVSRIRAMVAADLGVAVLPRSDAAAPDLPIRTIPIHSPGFIHRLSLCWRQGRRHSPAARVMLQEAQQAYPSAPPA